MNKFQKRRKKINIRKILNKKDNINICRQICGQSPKEKENMKKEKCEKNPEIKKKRKKGLNKVEKFCRKVLSLSLKA